MDYFNDVLAMFLSLDRIRILAVYGRVRELSEFIKNILICVPKMNEGLTGLERHEVSNTFWVNYPFNRVKVCSHFNNVITPLGVVLTGVLFSFWINVSRCVC